MNIKFLLILIYIIFSIPKLHSNVSDTNKNNLIKKIKDKQIFNQIFDKARENLRAQWMKYYHDRGIKIDDTIANIYLEKIINQEINLYAKAASQLYLGEMYYFGLGISKDYLKAKALFEEAMTEKKNSFVHFQAKMYLADIYYFGNGIEKDYAKAKALYEEAANQNVNILIKAASQYQLAAIYFFGYGVDKDYKKTKSFLESLISTKDDHHISVMAMLLMGAIEYLENNHNKAKKLFEEAILKNSNDCEFKVVLPENKNDESLSNSSKKAKILIELLSQYVFNDEFDKDLYFEKAKILFEQE